MHEEVSKRLCTTLPGTGDSWRSRLAYHMVSQVIERCRYEASDKARWAGRELKGSCYSRGTHDESRCSLIPDELNPDR